MLVLAKVVLCNKNKDVIFDVGRIYVEKEMAGC